MFGSTSSFGQSSTSPFGSQSVFGQTSSASSNPFAQKPFGSPKPFGYATGSSVFGGTSTGVFGQPSTPAFGVSSSPAFGSSTPAFGASSTSASLGGSSVFGQKPTFGGFGSTANQTNPFGQQTQPTFGSNLFGSATPFGASSQPAFGATSTPAFGSTSTPAFGSTSGPAFGATPTPAFGATTAPAFGSTTSPAFGSTATPLFGSTGAAFGASSNPAFGSTAMPAFGTQSSTVFGSSNTPAFGASTTPTFGSSTIPAFGASTTPSFGFGSSPSFGPSSSAFGSTPFGTTPSPFGAQSSSFGSQTATPTFGSPSFGQASFGGQRGGSRVVAYNPTPETDGTSGTQAVGKLESISAMPTYKEKSHDELRWEDYQLGDKGGPNPAGQPAGGTGFAAPTQPTPFGSPGTFSQPAGNPFSSSTSSNPFGPKNATFGQTGFGSSSSSIFSSSLNASSSSPFGSTSSTTSLFGASSGSAFGSSSSPSLFGGSSAPAFGSSSSIFGSSGAGSSPAFGSGLSFGNTQSSGLFQSTSSIGQTPSPFGQSATGFQLSTPSSGSNLFSTPSTGFGGSLFTNSAPSILSASNPAGFGQATPSLSTVFPQTAPSQASGMLSFGNFGQAQPASSGNLGSTSSIFGQGTFAQPAAAQSAMVVQPAPVTNPFGTLPATPQMSIGHVGSAPSIQYGISTMPVAEKPVPVRVSSLLAPRHMSQRRLKLPQRKYHPKSDGPRVPFFRDDEEASTTPKADAFVIPRENPRALVIHPVEQRPSRSTTDKQFGQKITHTSANENGNPADNGHNQQQNSHPLSPTKPSQKQNGFHADHAEKESDSSPTTFSGHKAREAAVVYEHGADIEALVPKLHHAEYYTEPRIQEMAAKERSEPGFCCHVKDFVVGRHGYGSIMFDGETDVRRLDLDSIIQFNNREVIAYKDEGKKPPIGQGLNKPAEVTLLNIMCINKKTGLQYTEGPKVQKYKEMLMKKAQEQGAEFVSYDAVRGEWKFKVKHFSSYGIRDGHFIHDAHL
ncbi:nuclear pore complex protein NUP98A-like isoform X2 [Phoenix dactylifera]|uniref:Nucleoporin autopeptidase n=1 Tax=Phoenix dactylifera TaxID=42345 RepID=A0A8B7CJ10_PHODC|nr:nuclear pore complex protein NUP98A-like isoform X2 [Phoenix dactylifera]